ncbi:MAG: pyridoxal-phosphate dependent enzyme [Myxococcales bacterium]|nr:pyridoxal-phosphate dependent enzyme [Polyangiaceae bacterium]MDW8251726.1 pyridoxal-phosphate dependent enzyme [Myxococcales bacterium]
MREHVTSLLPRLHFAHTPTPLQRIPRLSERLGVDLWIKRDDATGGVEAGNKVRKLEFLLADALSRRSNLVMTCGALQSNHCRATAALAARLGLRCQVFLRTEDPSTLPPLEGNALLMRLLGAELVLISPAEYRERNALMASEANRLQRLGLHPYIIPEGGSNGLGSLGYVAAMEEVRQQLDLGLGGGKPFDLVVHACGSGGTAAGVALGAARFQVADRVVAAAVCDSSAYFQEVFARICEEARALDSTLPPPAPLTFEDRWKGPRYGVSSPEQLRFLVDVARTSGFLLDPVYTGKAFFTLARLVASDPSLLGKRVLFLHTGGLPGLLAEGEALAPAL